MNQENDVKSRVFSASSIEHVEEHIQEFLQLGTTPTLAIIFCSVVHQLEELGKLFTRYNIDVFGATSSGELANDNVSEESIVVMLLYISPDVYKLNVFDAQGISSYQVGQSVAKWAATTYDKPAIMLMSAGLHADGEQIVNGVIDAMGYEVPLFGGLAADDLKIQGTYVFNASQVIANGVIALIFDRNAIELQGVAVTGWKGIGTAKTITKAEGNMVYTIDDEPTLDVYRKYLNVTGQDTAFAVEYPLLLMRDDGSFVLRAAVIVNEDKSMVYAGTVPEGAKVRFSMPPGFDIVELAVEQLSTFKQDIPKADAIVLFSCIARHLVLGDLMIKDEMSAIYNLWNAPLVGLFTYGEIGPTLQGTCDFHNGTLSLVLIKAQ